MRIGFDISQIAHPGGVANYINNLAEQLQNFKDLEMIFFYSSFRKPFKGNLKKVKSFRLPPTLFEVLFNRMRNFPIEKFLGPIDIFHSSDWVQPPTKAKKVTTYHDVIPLKFPAWSHPKIVDVHKRRLRIVEKEIDMVIAVSESTKRDLIEISKIPDEKIVVIYEGVNNSFKRSGDEQIWKLKDKYKLPDKYVLSLGGIGKRKNLDRIKEASLGTNLVILGETIPQVLQEELPVLYSGAEVLLYPSLYEGFGLPILEAMSCGTAVITSNRSSMPEVAGDGAILVNPENIDEISSSLKKVLNDLTLKKELINKGLEQAKKFTWKKTAEETLKVYQKVLGI